MVQGNANHSTRDVDLLPGSAYLRLPLSRRAELLVSRRYFLLPWSHAEGCSDFQQLAGSTNGLLSVHLHLYAGFSATALAGCVR